MSIMEDISKSKVSCMFVFFLPFVTAVDTKFSVKQLQEMLSLHLQQINDTAADQN